jgi:hypothetical protein
VAFAKKFSRRITVEDETYLWYLRDNSLEFEPRRIVVQHVAPRGQMLIIDPLSGPYALGFEIRPRVIREIVLCGLRLGWNPQQKAEPFYLGHDGQHFVRLESADGNQLRA